MFVVEMLQIANTAEEAYLPYGIGITTYLLTYLMSA